MVVHLGSSVTVSAKIDRELKEKMLKLGLSPSEVIKRAIEAEVREREWEDALKGLEKVRPIVQKVGTKGWVTAIRESREHR